MFLIPFKRTYVYTCHQFSLQNLVWDKNSFNPFTVTNPCVCYILAQYQRFPANNKNIELPVYTSNDAKFQII